MDTTDRIRTFIVEELLVGSSQRSVDDDASLYDGILDSIALMQLTSFIEDEFRIAVGDDDLTPENFRTVTSIARLVDERTGRG